MKPNTETRPLDYDVMVVGAGVAGMETAASMGDMGYRVLLVDKDASIGGRAILLSKVFPTLDCASCIVTPKMASVSHHPNVQIMTYSEVDSVVRNADGSFAVDLHKKASYVDFDACTGCGKCEEICTVTVPDQYNYGLVTRRVAHIPFPQAIPKKAVIDRRGEAPCTFTCPGNVKASGYISLVRAGRFKEAFDLHLENAPLVGSLARACYAPCESDCTRGDKEGTVQIRGIKRFMADHYYAEHPEPEYGPVEHQLATRVAVVGSGPAGLSAAFYLAREGHQVTIFEAESKPGGMLRTAIPPYRCPNDVVDRDIKNVTALGVQIKTGHRVTDLSKLKQQGFNAILITTGASDENGLDIDGHDLDGIMGCMHFLHEINIGTKPDVKGKTVMVIGGGNSAMDPARAAIRMGAKRVIINYRRGRKEMPAHEWEIDGAIEEGVELMLMSAPTKFIGNDGKLVGVECITMELGEPDESGRRRPVPLKGSEKVIPVDMAVLAIGLLPSTTDFPTEMKNSKGLLIADPQTRQTAYPDIFACGDCVTAPTMIINAIAQGRRAAFYMDRHLKNESMDVPFDGVMEKTDKAVVLDEAKRFTKRQPIPQPVLSLEKRRVSFECYEQVMTEEEARQEALRCMNCGECSQCMECVSVCAPNCIDFSQKPTPMSLNVGSVVMSTGFKILDPATKELLGYDRYPNVVSGPQMDRLLAPTRPFNGVLRPSDGKEPESIAILLCVGSRDQTVCNPLCCRIGCMYSIKQAQLAMGALPMADITIYTIDIRAFGKGYNEFYEQAIGMGIEFVKGKVARIDELPNGNLQVHYEDMLGEGGKRVREHDLVVLTVGFLPNTDAFALYKGEQLGSDDFGYVREIDPFSEPSRTNVDGLFAAGTTIGVMDIPDTVLHSGAAATQAAAYIERTRGQS
ncbi:MAG: FAD-dependent oxidoreductase [Rhodoferax sp.]|uniref:FAD-dependent oxidoreductase n=1 Tax=Rhodoferax sp. TaxID=50421 RepID=UPI001B6CBE92|nr:FAD-dependent oxidoreductase [Rhodoferax sp.]MBP9147686.1 FAD-dependent oxidoreductase [Rhodoferax sp.]MBP9734847.1 FAD-dependent oxidoreductase [Rhodoferax sp.]